MSGRTEQIFSKVRRNLNEFSDRNLKDKLVYQTMQEAQKQIVMLTQCLEKEIIITTVAGQEAYNLGIANISSVSNEIIKRGTTAERIAFALTLGTTDIIIWIDTDEETTYSWDGEKWI